MVGREKEFSVHFVPGNCQLVEVKEPSQGSRGNRAEEGFSGRPGLSRRRAAPRHLLSPGSPGSPGRRQGVCLPVALRFLSALPASAAGTEYIGLLWVSPLPSREGRGAF